ncbi:uncharacterized protein [Rutidosis leptorrhynchoides]|uniref:uncharacterized protein n=1 Tax=Rutidosis leptorrhynchoides TaxID=125765 RepID=UPI003A9A090D
MKPSFMYLSLLAISIFLYEVQGIRLGNLSTAASDNEEFVIKSLSSNHKDGLVMASDQSLSGINRKLMKIIISSTSAKTKDKNIHKKFTRGKGKTAIVFERYPDIINLTEMDYSPAKRKPPIHN